MQAAIALATKAKTKGQREEILKDKGLHNVEVSLIPNNKLFLFRHTYHHATQHFLWHFRFSDPYRAYLYDTLHSNDLGKWGKHLWVLLLAVLEKSGGAGKLTER